jgi:thiosulfate reductase cytochrome b subunit
MLSSRPAGTLSEIAYIGVSVLELIHPRWVRLTHWLNAVAVILMVTSGWQIYNASPIFGHWTFPTALTLGGWLGGALLWHFAAMWLLALNLVVYVSLGVASGRFRRKWWPVSLRDLAHDLGQALRGKLRHDDISVYNAVQRVAYIAIVLDLAVLVASGLGIWKPVQFSGLVGLLGGYDNGRVVHFCAMAFLVAFLLVHIVMVMLVPKSLLAMIRGH